MLLPADDLVFSFFLFIKWLSFPDKKYLRVKTQKQRWADTPNNLFPDFRDARNMAKDVQTALYEIAEELGSMTRTQATDYIKKLMTKGRYSQDVWS